MGEIAALRSVSFSYAVKSTEVLVFRNFSLSLEAGETTVILGPSGCGKTTLVRLIGGLLRPDSGKIMFNGQEVEGPSRERQIVFQEDSCFPWMTVYNNVKFPGNKATHEINSVLELVRLQSFRDFLPQQLSLGMRQRVALARALVGGTFLLLLDEPLRSLDAFTRSLLQEELRELLPLRLKAALWITHDLEEALILGDRIVVVGGSPLEIMTDTRHPLGAARNEYSRFSIEFQQEYRKLFEMVIAKWEKI